MQTETELKIPKKVYTKLMKAGQKLIDYGETAYEEVESGALVARRTPAPELLELVNITTNAIAEAKQSLLSQLRKEIEGVTSKPESWDCKCGLTHYMDKNYDYNLAIKDVLNLLQETK